MKEVFLLISESGACLFSPGESLDRTYVKFDIEDLAVDAAKLINDGLGISFKGIKLVLVANCKKTIIRVADVHEFNHKRVFFHSKISDGDAWEVIKSVFPIGPSINEETHLFDVCLFGDKKYVCFGLPVGVCERFAEIGVELAGSIHRVSRLETIENLMFAEHSNDCKIVIFPQDDGFRVLAVRSGLPEDVFFISNHPDRREAELERILDCLGDQRGIFEIGFKSFGASSDLGWVSKYGAMSFGTA